MEEKVENKNRTYLFFKTCIVALLVSIGLRVLVAIILEETKVTSLRDIFDSTLLIPYILFILFQVYETFIKKQNA